MFRRVRPQEEEEGESVFVSMTDLTVSMLMLVIILLGFFASQMRDVRAMRELEETKVALGERDAQLADTETRIGILTSELSEETATRQRLEQDLEERDAQLAEASGALKQTLAALTSLDADHASLSAAYSDLLELNTATTIERDELLLQSTFLSDQLSDAQELIAGLEIMLGARTDELTTAKDRITNLQAELKVEKDARAHAEGQLARARTDLAQTREELLRTATTLTNERTEHEATEAARVALAGKAAELSETLSEKLNDIVELVDELEATRQRVVTAEKALEDEMSSHMTTSKLKSGLEDEVAVLLTELAESEARLAAVGAELAKTQTVLNQTIGDLLAARGEMDDARISMTGKITTLEADLASSLVERDALSASLARLEEEKVALTEDLTARAAEVAVLEGNLHELSETKAGLEASVAIAEVQISDLDTQLDDTIAVLAEVESAREALAIQNQTLAERVEVLSLAYSESEDEASKLLDELRLTQEKAEIPQAELVATKQEVASLKTHIEKIKLVFELYKALLKNTEAKKEAAEALLAEREAELIVLQEELDRLTATQASEPDN